MADRKRPSGRQQAFMLPGDLFPSSPPSPSDGLPPSLRSLAQQKAKLREALMTDYQQIHHAAAQGKPVSAGDFTMAERRFNEGFEAVNAKEDEAFPSVAKTAWQADRLWHQYDEAISNETRYPDRFFETHTHLNTAFYRQKVSSAAHRENTQWNGKTQEELIAGLLSQNRGVALADWHSQDETARFVTDHIGTFKAAGVDTLYLEYPSDLYKDLYTLSAQELRQLAKDRHYKGYTMPSSADIAAMYKVPKADDVFVEVANMVAAARENDIRVVCMDKCGVAATFENNLSANHRIASTNFTWTDVIDADQKALAEQDKRGGKFIVFGGLAHFTKIHEVNGMVDEALGIPVIAFDRRAKDAQPQVRAEKSPNGPDFYLNGGEDYMPLEKIARVADIGMATQLLRPLQFAPGVPEVVKTLERMSGEKNAEISKLIYDVPSPPPEPEAIPILPVKSGGRSR